MEASCNPTVAGLYDYSALEVTLKNGSGGNSNKDEISAGAIAGIVIGCFAVLLIIAIIAFIIIKKKSKHEKSSSSSAGKV